MEDLSVMLARAMETLPDDTAVSPEHILIAKAPRSTLRRAQQRAQTSFTAAQTEFEGSGLALRGASDAYLAATPMAEYIESVAARDDHPADSGDSAAVPGMATPSADEVRAIVEDVDGNEPDTLADLDKLFSDADGMLEARRALEQARGLFDTARVRRDNAQSQLELSSRVRAEAKRLGRVPQAIIGAVLFTLLGLGAYQSEQNLHENAKAIIASGAVHPGTKRYNAVYGFADNEQSALLEGVSEMGAAFAGIGAWWAVSDRMARPRARLIIRRAVRQARSSGDQ